MLEAGEDPRFIARRLVILASRGRRARRLQGARSSPTRRPARSSSSGCPRPALNLAHAVLHLALAPKSNSVDGRARCGDGGGARPPGRPGADAPARRALPRRRRRSATARATSILTTRPQGWVPQEHLPAEVAGERFYRPSRHGAEPGMSTRSSARRRRRTTTRPSEEQVTMSTSDVLAVVAATVVDDPRRGARGRARRCSRARCATLRATVDALHDEALALLDDAHDAVARRRDRGRPRRATRRRRPSASTTRSTARNAWPTRRSRRRSSRRWRSAPACPAPRNACAKASRPHRPRPGARRPPTPEAGVVDVQAPLLARRRVRARARLVVGGRRAGCAGSPARYAPADVVDRWSGNVRAAVDEGRDRHARPRGRAQSELRRAAAGQ